MFRKILISTSFLLCCYATFAQSYFEFRYHYESQDGSKDEYRALVLRNPDGTGIMRIVYNGDGGEKHLVEMNINEEYGTGDDDQPDSSILMMIGSEERQIIGAEGDYTADHFVFVMGKDGYYEPASVMTLVEDTVTEYGTFDDVRLLNDADFTEDFVLEYFTKEEDFYKDMFVAETRALTPKEKQTRLHLVLVANTNDKKIGKTCEIDLRNTIDTYKTIAEFLGIPLVQKIVSGNDFSKLNVDNAINGIRPSPQDIVVFYYTGHGFNETKDAYRYPYLDLRDKTYQEYGEPYTVNMEVVYQKIKAKGARLNLVFSDCCNNDPEDSQNMTSADPDTRVSSIGWDKNKCMALFLDPKRMSILATAAQKGELSAGNVSEGGFFTSNFLQSLEKHIGKVRATREVLGSTWTSVITHATKETTTRASRKWCRMPDESVKACVQHPVFKME